MRIVESSRKKSVLQIFASSFHQDMNVMGVGWHEWGTELARSLTQPQRAELREQLTNLLAEYPGKTDEALLNAWKRLGASGWPRKIGLRSVIAGWIEEFR